MRCRPPARVAAFGAAALLALSANAAAKDYAGTALNIIPSGQWGNAGAPPAASEQASMYDGLTPLFDQVTSNDLTTYFKPETFGTGGSQCPCTTESVPRKGVRIVRDRYNVPHITGRNRLDLDWAAGWVLAQDRALLLSLGRYPARFAALDAPGVDAFGLVTSLSSVKVTAQADRIIDREQTAALKARGREGRALLKDIDEYVKGINARLTHDKVVGEPWRRVDVYAINALAGQIFGQGGGDETRRAMLLDGLDKKLGAAAGRRVFDDLSERTDDDAPATIAKRFPYGSVPAKAPGSTTIDNGSMNATALAAVANATSAHRNMSNFLIVSGRRSTNGHPLFVAGPQIGYFYPGLTLEMDLRAPGIQARGAAMPGGAGNLLIGRGQDFAWSLTSAGSDTNDQFVETLCGGSKTKYLYKGKCRRMGFVNAGTITGRGAVKFNTTVHGPVLGYARVKGKQVAISFQRSSHGKDILWQLAFKRFTDGKVTGVRSFFAAAATSPFTFNVGYADDRDIAMYSTGLLPLRDRRTDPRLPTIGTGRYEWKGWLPAKDHPQVVNPSSGQLVNWNNKPAAGFPSADDNWAQGSVQRVQMLEAGLAKRSKHDLASVTSAMNAAATQDLRVQGSLLPAIQKVLAGSQAPSPRSQQLLDLLGSWRNGGSSRLDRDLDGTIDAGPAALVMDELYPRIADKVFEPLLGADLTAQLASVTGRTNATTSGFTGGRINYLDKDLRALTGTRFRSPFKTRFCGNGDLAACRAAIWQAFEETGAALAAARGSEDPATWTADANKERIRFAPGLLSKTIRYTNRPSGIQQVISFTGHRRERR
jgi:acyl-homoserine lactone acylase PvdQ